MTNPVVCVSIVKAAHTTGGKPMARTTSSASVRIAFTEDQSEILSQAFDDVDDDMGCSFEYRAFEPESSRDGAGGVMAATSADFRALRDSVARATDMFISDADECTDRPAHWRNVARQLRRKMDTAVRRNMQGAAL